jgi:hypothetical protein
VQLEEDFGQVAFVVGPANLKARSFGNSDPSPPILREATRQDVGVRRELELVSDGGHRLAWPLQPSPKDSLRGKDVLGHVEPDRMLVEEHDGAADTLLSVGLLDCRAHRHCC